MDRDDDAVRKLLMQASRPPHSDTVAGLENIAQASPQLQAQLYAPLSPEEAGEIVNELIRKKAHLPHPERTNEFAHGIPSTRAEFDAYGKFDGQRLRAVKDIVLRIPNGTPEQYAVKMIRTLKQHHVPVMEEFHRRGIDASDYWQSVTDPVLKPAEIDLGKLDARLTPKEAEYVSFYATAAKIMREKGIMSTEQDAPAQSNWAEQVRASTTQEALDAISKARSK